MMNKTRIKNILFLIVMALVAASCSQGQKKWRIGVSQCSEDIWRDKLNRELTIGGYVDDRVELEFLSAGDNDQKQIEQIRHFISEKVDLLICSPNSAAKLSPVIDKAYDTGFSAPSYFAKCFKDEYGMSPGEIRGNRGN